MGGSEFDEVASLRRLLDLSIELIAITATHIDERKDLERSLRQRISLEELVATVAARLIGTDGVNVLPEIEAGIGQLAEALGADRAYFLRGSRHADDTTFVEWSAGSAGRRAEDLSYLTDDNRRWWLEHMRSGHVVRVPDVEQLAKEAPDIVAVLRDQGVRSFLMVPLPPHRRFYGFMGLVSVSEPTEFSDDVAALLRVAGECFMSALGRTDAGAALGDARRELEHRNDELERSNEELERFAYATAHDLKAPLSRVEMALAAATMPPGDEGQLLDVARRGAGRLRQLIEDLLTFAAVGNRQGPPTEVDLDEVLTEALIDLESVIEAAGTEVRRAPLPMMWGHRPLLGQLLQNLIANALAFTRAGVAPIVSIEATDDGDATTLRISDNGIGIDEAHRNDVFGVFTRLNSDDQFPGSGIGLATCAKVVAHHDGRIWVEDGIDGGTTVVVHFPHVPTGS